MHRTALHIAVAESDNRTAWAFVLRESAPKVRDRFVHSATGFGGWHWTVGGFLALAAGLQAIRERGKGDASLTVWCGVREVFLAMTTPVRPLGEVAAMLCDECREELANIRSCTFKEHVYADENPADRLARWTWESGTFVDFPDRPTGRRWLAPFTREVVA